MNNIFYEKDYRTDKLISMLTLRFTLIFLEAKQKKNTEVIE